MHELFLVYLNTFLTQVVLFVNHFERATMQKIQIIGIVDSLALINNLNHQIASRIKFCLILKGKVYIQIHLQLMNRRSVMMVALFALTSKATEHFLVQ